MGNSRRAKSSTAVARESIQTLFIYARRLLSGCPRAHGLALLSMDIHPRTADSFYDDAKRRREEKKRKKKEETIQGERQ